MVNLDIPSLLSQLTIDEKVSLLAGIDFWHTRSLPAHNLPSLRLTDGPNGIRGTRFFDSIPAACFPCGTGLGATWDSELLRKVGEVLGEECRAKGGHVWLGPTVNIQRSPLGGRGFESYSEDPTLSGALAASVVNGIQSKGVASTIKHFVCNDQEEERQAVTAIVSERALREIYLRPFQIAVRDAKPWSLMTAYNRVNGTHCSEDKRLLQDVLRGEWGWEGMIMSDWYGIYSTVPSLLAGVDLEMPGPTAWRDALVMRSITSRKVFLATIDARVQSILQLHDRVRASGVAENAEEGTRDTPETSSFLRKVAGEGIVLLRNEENVLPLKKDKRIAIIGPNTKTAQYCGGGSASLRPYRAVTPFEGVSDKVGDVKYALGATSHRELPTCGRLLKTKDGKKGFTFTIFVEPPEVEGREAIDTFHLEDTDIHLVDYKNEKVEGSLFYCTMEGIYEPEESGEHMFGLTVFGTGRLFIDGKLVVDNATNQRAGGTMYGNGTVEEVSTVKLEAGKAYDLKLEFGSAPTATYRVPGGSAIGAGGLRLGLSRVLDSKAEIEKAAKLAGECEQAVVFVGLNSDWECESRDRDHMDLPGHQDALVSACLAANPNTVVVIQSGTPVTLPWEGKCKGLIQAWYGGNETGHAIADILFGDVNPSGKLPLSWPIRNEDNPAFLNFGSERGRTLYGEDVYVGYRFYEKTRRKVLFPFGHGLSYTTFSISDVHVVMEPENDGLTVTCTVTNTGPISGREVVQVYVSPPSSSAVMRPVKELRGFKKVFLEPGKSDQVEVQMSRKYATSFWDEDKEMWCEEAGKYLVHIGSGSADTPLSGEFEVRTTGWWGGV